MPGMSDATIQFVIRALVITICAAVLAIVGIDAGCIFHFGDGEAIRLIGQLNGPLVTLFGVLGSTTVLHQIINSIISRFFPSGVSVTPPSSSGNVATMHVPVSIPVPVQMPESVSVKMSAGSGESGT